MKAYPFTALPSRHQTPSGTCICASFNPKVAGISAATLMPSIANLVLAGAIWTLFYAARREQPSQA